MNAWESAFYYEIENWLAEQDLSVDPGFVEESTTFEQLQLDDEIIKSQLYDHICTKYNLEITSTEFWNCHSIGNLKDLVMDKYASLSRRRLSVTSLNESSRVLTPMSDLEKGVNDFKLSSEIPSGRKMVTEDIPEPIRRLSSLGTSTSSSYGLNGGHSSYSPSSSSSSGFNNGTYEFTVPVRMDSFTKLTTFGSSNSLLGNSLLGSSYLNGGRNPVNGDTGIPQSRQNELKKPGIVGLRNLGNTCFMNSAIQCLSNTELLTEHFLSGNYKKDINKSNPLGMKGQMAEAFGALIKEMWSGSTSSVSLTDCKRTIAQYASQFSGYQQHDCQEFLAFLLDGLHEDLNRIKDKQYIEVKDYDGKKPDWEVAEENWNNHKKRNDSIIVDNFHGQYKSRLVCPECQKVSITFDPFMYLSLPLPTGLEDQKSNRITLVDKEGFAFRHNIKTTKTATVSDLMLKLTDLTGKDLQDLIIIQVKDCNFAKAYNLEDPVSSLEGDVFIYEVKRPNSSCAIVGVKQRVVKSKILDPKLVGYPFLIPVNYSTTLEEIQSHVWKRVRHFLGEDSKVPPVKPRYTLAVMEGSKVLVQMENTPFEMKKRQYIAVDWDPATFDSFFQDYKPQEDRKATGTTQMTLQDCLELWAAVEKLSAKDPWYCPTCKQHREAFKKLDMWRAPKILVIHLKRFNFHPNRMWMRDKLDTFVDFPIEGLDLTGFVQGPKKDSAIYDLFAVSNHMGSLGGGHYTATCKNRTTDKWYNFDDNVVTPESESRIKTKYAYVLFYARRDN